MKNSKLIAFILSILMISGSFITPVTAVAASGGTEQIRVIVGFKAGAVRSMSGRDSAIAAAGGQIQRSFSLINAASATMSVDEAARLALDPAIAYVEPDYPVYSLGQTIPWGEEEIIGNEAYPFPIWDTASGAGIKLAVLDTGIDAMHADLPALAGGFNCVSSGSYNTDIDGHGTHVAGIIAAADNTAGVVGVAPNIDLYAVKVLDDSGGGNVSDVIEGVEWAVTNNINIINMSLGTADISSALQSACDAAEAAGVLIVAAAGNDGNSSLSEGNVLYPAKYASVIAVAASDSTGDLAYFSNTGPEIELIAPGVDVLSTVPGQSAVLTAGGVVYEINAIEGSSSGDIAGPLVDCGAALSEGAIASAMAEAGITDQDDWIALIDRDGINPFSVKVRNAMNQGAVGAIIVNNNTTDPDEPDRFTFSDGSVVWVPTGSVSYNSGTAIRSDILLAGVPKQASLVIIDHDAYDSLNGTSMAAPHVAAAAALIWSANPALTNDQIRALLTENTEDLGLSDSKQGYGFVRADLALQDLLATYPVATPITLNLSGFIAGDKAYDGNDDVTTGAGFSDDREAGDDLRFSYSANFSDKDAGADKAVGFTNILISGGEDRYRYTLAQTTGAAIASITPADLTITTRDVTKAYGDSDPSFSTIGTGFAPDETVASLSGTLVFDRAAGEALGDYTVTPSGLTGSNYTITYAPGTLTIAQKSLTIGGSFTAGDKLVDGSTSAIMGTNDLVLVGIVAGEDVALKDVVIGFDSAAAGKDKIVRIKSAALDGADKAHYTLSLTGSPTDTATITDPNAAGGGGGGGGGGLEATPEEIIPEVTTLPAITAKVTLVFGIGQSMASLTTGDSASSIQPMDVAPMLYEDRTLLPIRFVVSPLGGSLIWDATEQKVTITRGTTIIELWIGSSTARVNGVDRLIDPDNPNVKPLLVNPGRTMLPLRFIAEALGCTVDWNPATQTVTVTEL